MLLNYIAATKQLVAGLITSGLYKLLAQSSVGAAEKENVADDFLNARREWLKVSVSLPEKWEAGTWVNLLYTRSTFQKESPMV